MNLEDNMGLVVEDAQQDSIRTEFMDFGFGAASIVPTGQASGGVRYIGLNGLAREKTVKVQRFQEIIELVAHQIIN